MLEVVAAVVEAVGAGRVGLRLSPFNSFLDATDTTPYDTNDYLIKELNKMGLAYLHLVRGRGFPWKCLPRLPDATVCRHAPDAACGLACASNAVPRTHGAGCDNFVSL
jgi:2,4-dienoyl-CoA reductase-like NADH-dependent reductase (Old Yellow Enzyme family)